MLLYPAMNDLLKNTESRYLLVNVVSQRARNIAEAADVHEIALEKKPVSMAINEVATGNLCGRIVKKEEA